MDLHDGLHGLALSRARCGINQRQPGYYLVIAAAEAAQHTNCILVVPWLAEDLSIQDDDGIRAKDKPAIDRAGDGRGLSLGERGRLLRWSEIGRERFRFIADDDVKIQPEPPQEVSATR